MDGLTPTRSAKQRVEGRSVPGFGSSLYVLFCSQLTRKVPGFTFCLLVINQARPKQFPVMLLISGIGYVVTYFSSLHFTESQVASALGAFAIGVCGHVYSRWLIPFVQLSLIVVSMDCMIRLWIID